MTRRREHDVVVIGAGHAGLSTSYGLTQRGCEHVVLERDSVGSSWRRRWESFTLVTPNWSLALPGHHYDGDDPDAFLPRDEVVEYLRRYVERYRLPVREAVRVGAVMSDAGGGYLVTTENGDLSARAVVVSVGFFQRPRVPAGAAALPNDVVQRHSSEYTRPDDLPEGAVLVVGSGQSGCQIAEELHAAGRRVYLSTSSAGRAPRRYRGRDVMRWVAELGMFDQPVTALATPAAKFAANPHVSGSRGGHTINLHRLARDGVTLLGRFTGVRDGRLRFAPDLHENLAAADGFAATLRQLVDDHVLERGIDAPPPDPDDDHDGEEGYGPAPEALDPERDGVSAVVWATGFSYDYGWIDVPGLLDADGYPRHSAGVSDHPGLYFVGLKFQTRQASDLFVRVGLDAEHVAEHVAGYLNGALGDGALSSRE
jgi:putative flavoprotein involved in K+ transport